jgi:hypothetical protein
MIANSPKVGHDLISRIPRLEAVADIIAHQGKLAKAALLPERPRSDESVPLGARVLNLGLDFDELIESGLSSSEAFSEIRRRGNRYEESAVAALRAIVEASETMYAVREIDISELADHTILAENIMANTGVLLVAKGQEVTRSLQVRLENFLLRRSINQTVKVFVPIETPSYRRESDSLPMTPGG